MFSECERRYLVRLARVFKLRGMHRDEVERAIIEDVGAFCSRNAVRCAVRNVFPH